MRSCSAKVAAAKPAFFAWSEAHLAALGERALTAEQRRQLESVVASWLAANRELTRVEGVRLSDFASTAGAVADERTSQVKGLLSSVKSASRAADQALLLGERGLFLLHRLPFLWRLQARLASQELLGDAIERLAEGPDAPIPRLAGAARRVLRQGLALVAVVGGAGVLLWWLGPRARRRALHPI